MTTILVGKNYRIEQCMKCRHCDDFIECKYYEKTGTKCETIQSGRLYAFFRSKEE